jgi:hypothetical protein
MATPTGERKKKRFDRKQALSALRLNPGERTEEETYAINAAGGRAAAEARRRRAAMREVARTMLDTELRANDTLRHELEDRGFQDYTEAAAVLLAQLNRARAGDTEAAKFLRDTSGQRPADQLAIGNLDDRPFETLDLSALSDEDLNYLLEQRGGLGGDEG